MTAAHAVLVFAAAIAAGCGASPKTSYYTLDAGGTPAAAHPSGVSVVVGPVTLPETVDRPQLVVRASANRVDIAELHRWAEPLKSEIPRVVAANLARELGSARVSGYPQHALSAPDFTVLIDVQRFDSVSGEAVTIEALWSIRRAAGGELRSGRSAVREPVAGAGYDALVAAHARALARISGEIAAALRGPAGPG